MDEATTHIVEPHGSDKEDARPTGNWVGSLTEIITLTDAEKRCLGAVVVLGSFSVDASSSDYPDEVADLVDKGFLVRERVGERLRGRNATPGVDVYRPTEIAKEWLQNCHREGE